MAIIGFSAGTPFAEAAIRKSFDRQRRWIGAVQQFRVVYRATAIWPIDASGGEDAQVPDEYVDTYTYRLTSLETDLGYEGLNGHCTAIYEYDTGW